MHIRRSRLFAAVLIGSLLHANPTSAEAVLSEVSRDLDLPTEVDASIVLGDSVCRLAATTEGRVPRFHSASITKLLTATVIAQLVEEGRLDYTDKVGVHLPEFTDASITIEELLTHTSGLRDRDRAAGRNTVEDVDAYVRRLARQGDGRRGHWRYADANFNLLGRIIEVVDERSYAEAIEWRLLTPLGMTASTFAIAQIPEADRVRAFDRRGRAEAHPWDLAFLPSSGLQTTADDLALFARAVLKLMQSGDGILLQSSMTTMTSVHVKTEWTGIGQGYGWQIADTAAGPQWRHAGGEAGFESLLAVYPAAEIAVVVLGNRRDWPRFELEGGLRETALAMSTCSDQPGAY